MLTSCGGQSSESIDPLNPGTKVIKYAHKMNEDEGKIYKQIQTNLIMQALNHQMDKL